MDQQPALRSSDTVPRDEHSSFGTILLVFLKLGLTSFGGPIAHIGYFRDEFVVRRRWLSEEAYADLVALCQFLPGPASSQVGFSLGVVRGGLPGGAAAWIGFTLPSAVLMVLVAYGAVLFDGPAGAAILHGLKLAAVAVVAQAVWGMARTLAPDRTRASIALLAVVAVTAAGSGGIAAGQVGAIALGGMLGLVMCRGAASGAPARLGIRLPRTLAIGALVLFFVLLVLLPLAAGMAGGIVAVFDAFYRSGALVFGGGHVVLPLLRAEMVPPGWITDDTFLAGYGAAQAVPGPLFTFAAYLGVLAGPGPQGIAGAVLALVAIFLPAMLLALGLLPFWDGLRRRAGVQAAMRGTNAAVVGILGAALYDPVWTSAVTGPADFALALAAFVLLTAWKAPPWTVVAVCMAGGLIVAG
ncbi:MAG TPA: chromate efflux transporter [Arenibaculum sp.]|nr:chromate efflux transporter [Arenibaculum sp.]